MIPCRLTGKPFWDIYLFKDPPLWKAYLDAAKRFDNDVGFELYDYGPVDVVDGSRPGTEERIVYRDADRSSPRHSIRPPRVVRDRQRLPCRQSAGGARGPCPVRGGAASPAWTPVNPRPQLEGYAAWRVIREELGDHGVLGMSSGFGTFVLGSESDVYSWYDDPGPWIERIEQMTAKALDRIDAIAKLPVRPDFLTCGGSGTLIFQTPDFVRKHLLPGLKKVTRRAREVGISTHIHSCGPERALVDMVVRETDLTSIDPLEIRPMGDCDLADIKRSYGERIVLKGNLHTTQVMLLGSADDVRRASRNAIDAARAGGRFILSTGDQCGRDTPLDNIYAMVETARTYGRY